MARWSRRGWAERQDQAPDSGRGHAAGLAGGDLSFQSPGNPAQSGNLPPDPAKLVVGVAMVPVVLGGAAAEGALAALNGEAVLVAIVSGAAYRCLQRRERSACACDANKGCKADIPPEVKESE